MIRTRFFIIKFFRVGALCGSMLYADDITLPLNGGKIIITAPTLRLTTSRTGIVMPKLMFRLTNETSSSWSSLKVQFDIGGTCVAERRQWTLPVVISLGWADDQKLTREYSGYEVSLVGKMDGCTTESINTIDAKLLVAENPTTRIDCVAGEFVMAADGFKTSINCATDSEAQSQERFLQVMTKRDLEAGFLSGLSK